jgi:hypothetical protein
MKSPLKTSGFVPWLHTGARAAARLLLVSALLTSIMASGAAIPVFRTLAPLVSEEEENQGKSEGRESKLAFPSGASLRMTRHCTRNGHLGVVSTLRGQNHGPLSSRLDTFDRPLWEHAYRHGTGAPLRC